MSQTRNAREQRKFDRVFQCDHQTLRNRLGILSQIGNPESSGNYGRFLVQNNSLWLSGVCQIWNCEVTQW